MDKHGRIAFITTPEYRKRHPELIKNFVYQHIYSLCNLFDVLSTGRTYEFVMKIVKRPFVEVNRSNRSFIESDTLFPIERRSDLLRWQTTVKNGFFRQMGSIQGMIELAYELVEGRLDAIIHLTDWDDITGKADSMVIRRQANVHNVPIASDIHMAKSLIKYWKALRAKSPDTPIFQKRENQKLKEYPLKGLNENHRILAMIAHDGMKLELCRFAVQQARKIFEQFDYILATGTTGSWLKKFSAAAGYSSHETNKIRCCLSGPYGGDVEIAYAVVKQLCQKVIFFQDPLISHPHETDIRLFEQAVLSEDIKVKLATNAETAKVLLEVDR